MCEIGSKLTTYRHQSYAINVVLVSLLLPLNRVHTFFRFFHFSFEQENVSRVPLIAHLYPDSQ